MNLTPKRIFDIEVIISPVAMASIQTQFVVGNRQQVSETIYFFVENFPQFFIIQNGCVFCDIEMCF